MPTVAFPHDHSPQFARRLDIDGAEVQYNDQSVWAGIATLNGLPATTAPIGRGDDGLPIGAQIVGGYLEDRTTITFAELSSASSAALPPRRFKPLRGSSYWAGLCRGGASRTTAGAICLDCSLNPAFRGFAKRLALFTVSRYLPAHFQAPAVIAGVSRIKGMAHAGPNARPGHRDRGTPWRITLMAAAGNALPNSSRSRAASARSAKAARRAAPRQGDGRHARGRQAGSALPECRLSGQSAGKPGEVCLCRYAGRQQPDDRRVV